jgi:hypothetical protein
MCNTRRNEASLDELLHDTAMQLLMLRDGVTESDVRALLGRLKEARPVVDERPSRGGAPIATGRIPGQQRALRSTEASDARDGATGLFQSIFADRIFAAVLPVLSGRFHGRMPDRVGVLPQLRSGRCRIVAPADPPVP